MNAKYFKNKLKTVSLKTSFRNPEIKILTDSNSHTKCYTTKLSFIWFSYSLFLLSSLTSFRSNRFRVKSHQFSAAYLWRVTDYRFTRGHLVIYSLSICYRNLTNFLTINWIRLSTLYISVSSVMEFLWWWVKIGWTYDLTSILNIVSTQR